MLRRFRSITISWLRMYAIKSTICEPRLYYRSHRNFVSYSDLPPLRSHNCMRTANYNTRPDHQKFGTASLQLSTTRGILPRRFNPCSLTYTYAMGRNDRWKILCCSSLVNTVAQSPGGTPCVNPAQATLRLDLLPDFKSHLNK